jgi:hypothetical protein
LDAVCIRGNPSVSDSEAFDKLIGAAKELATALTAPLTALTGSRRVHRGINANHGVIQLRVLAISHF